MYEWQQVGRGHRSLENGCFPEIYRKLMSFDFVRLSLPDKFNHSVTVRVESSTLRCNKQVYLLFTPLLHISERITCIFFFFSKYVKSI